MNTLTKLALGMIGQLRPQPVQGNAASALPLPPPQTEGGIPLMQALRQRQSQREFAPDPLNRQVLSDLLWAAAGINRPDLKGRTAPSAMNSQEIDVYVALPEGLYRYEPSGHVLYLASATDVRRITGYQDFVDRAPLDLIFVADHARMKAVPAAQRESFASVAAGAMVQNVYLFCASAGLCTVIRAWIDRQALSEAMGLQADHQILLSQTVGLPVSPPRA
ncbi:MAG: SagB/ThcOx family dehydrogenase [Burkholderiales bacterium]|nr:SagB/ThcOx family dehydrogenase [Xanthomonadaceae bacterium]MBH2018754.1 SagB/ThcOx family dehydrogenase [Burkholderiales bacterium]